MKEKTILLLRIIFLIILPLSLAFIIFSPTPLAHQEFSSSGWSGNGTIRNQAGIIKYNLDQGGLLETRMRFASIFGGVLNLPLNKLCVSINGSRYLNWTSFKPAEVYFNNKKEIILYSQERDCFYLENSYENLVWIKLNYSYNTLGSNLSINSKSNYISEPFNIQFENNFLFWNNLFSAGFFIVSYWAIILLLVQIYKEISKIFNAKKIKEILNLPN